MFLKKNIKSILLIILGAFILAFGTYNLNLQNNITEGGVLGLLLFFENMFGISPSITSLCIDLSLFLLGMRFFGKKFLAFSLISTTSFSFFYAILEQFPPIFKPFTDNMLVGSLLCGIFVGVGVGLVVKAGGASGGDDVISLVISKFTSLKMNHVYMITDAFVLILSLMYLDISQIFWSLIAVFTSGKIISLIYYYSNTENNNLKNDEDIESSPTTI